MRIEVGVICQVIERLPAPGLPCCQDGLEVIRLYSPISFSSRARYCSSSGPAAVALMLGVPQRFSMPLPPDGDLLGGVAERRAL
ncbi:MAG: hypothetical protein ACLP0J_03600 [Solirubrobacteraceae bacterium]